jgi:hypothetical protein
MYLWQLEYRAQEATGVGRFCPTDLDIFRGQGSLSSHSPTRSKWPVTFQIECPWSGIHILNFSGLWKISIYIISRRGPKSKHKIPLRFSTGSWKVFCTVFLVHLCFDCGLSHEIRRGIFYSWLHGAAVLNLGVFQSLGFWIKDTQSY